MIRPLSAKEVLDRYFLEVRAKLLDIAAVLDRIDRGGGIADPRLDKVRRALGIVREPQTGRAEQLQQLFSLPYDPKWQE
jgi:hypothetical protein